MKVLLWANFEEDWNVENTAIASGGCVQLQLTTSFAVGQCLFGPSRLLDGQRVNGVLMSSDVSLLSCPYYSLKTEEKQDHSRSRCGTQSTGYE